MARSAYQHGRALMAKGDFPAARRAFERAPAARYPATGIDLGKLLSDGNTGMLDIPKSIALLEQAWRDGVTIAAFELGNLYEHGVVKVGDNLGYVLAPEQARAWSWYQKGAQAGEPNALARFAEKEDRAVLSAENAPRRNAELLKAFGYYASAAERARLEDWPEPAWRDWRYRRASIARLLGREGMMEQVAEAYDAVRKRYAPRPTVWQRLASSAGIK